MIANVSFRLLIHLMGASKPFQEPTTANNFPFNQSDTDFHPFSFAKEWDLLLFSSFSSLLRVAHVHSRSGTDMEASDNAPLV